MREAHRLVQRDRGSVVGEHLHVAPGGPAARRPAKQRLAQRSGVPLAAVFLDDVHGRQPRPPGSVGCRRHGRTPDGAVGQGREHHVAVHDRGQHVGGNVAHVCAQPLPVGPVRHRHRRSRCGRVDRQVGRHDHVLAVGRHTRWYQEQPVGDGQQRRHTTGRVPVDDRGQGAQVTSDLKRHGRIRPARAAVAVTQQPAVDPLLLDARPGQRGRVLEVADVTRTYGRCGQAPDRDHVGGGHVDHVVTLGADAQHRTHFEQMADHVGQRWHGTGCQAVTQADPGTDRRQIGHRGLSVQRDRDPRRASRSTPAHPSRGT